MSEWQDMSSAPRDGSWIWVYYPVRTFEDRQQVAHWSSDDDGEARWVDAADHIDWTQPIAWMPLPNPPQRKGEPT